MNIDWVFEYKLVWATIVFGNSRYSFYQMSNTLYQIQVIKNVLSDTHSQIHKCIFMDDLFSMMQ